MQPTMEYGLCENRNEDCVRHSYQADQGKEQNDVADRLKPKSINKSFFYTMAFIGTAPFGSLMAGASANYIGAPNTLIIGGICCVIGAFFFARKLPELKKMVRPVYIRMGILPEVAAGMQSASELTSPPED